MYDPETMDETLVMAMPRRELYTLNGFEPRIELPVLSSLEDEYWLAASAVIADDVEAKEVQVGVVFNRGSQVLVTENGVILHTTSITAEALEMGPCLKSLRNLARLGATMVIGTDESGSVLCGYLNDDQLEELRPYFVLVYEVFFAEGVEAPEAMSWIERHHLNDVALDPVSVHMCDYLAKKLK
jgi:hypothetical protein